MVFTCGLYHTEMAMHSRLTIDSAGRIIIPKPIRKELNLHDGDSLELESVSGGITLRPVPGSGPLVKEHMISDDFYRYFLK
jgi:AbrB family looped-hinge helix DNA binding protein